MLYMKEMRAKVVAECTLKESAAINQILGRRVSLNRSPGTRQHWEGYDSAPQPWCSGQSCTAWLDRRGQKQSFSKQGPQLAFTAAELKAKHCRFKFRSSIPTVFLFVVKNFLCLVSHFAVARPIAGGAGQVLRAGQERATAPHAAVPRLVSTRQLCKFLSLQVVTAFSFPRSLGDTTRTSSYTAQISLSCFKLLLGSFCSDMHRFSSLLASFGIVKLTRLFNKRP